MQASKIEVGTIYAVKLPGAAFGQEEDKLVRFRVEAVVTRRTGASKSPHDYKSSIEGRVLRVDDDTARELKLAPDMILGPYEQYQELQARAEAEKGAAEKIEAANRDIVTEAFELLHVLTGIELPEKDKSGRYAYTYRDNFCLSYSGHSIDLSLEGVKLLLPLLRSLIV